MFVEFDEWICLFSVFLTDRVYSQFIDCQFKFVLPLLVLLIISLLEGSLLPIANAKEEPVIVNNYICGDDNFVSETVLKITATNNGYGGRVAELSINNQKFDGWYYKGIFTSNPFNSPFLRSWYTQEGVHRHLIFNNNTYECVISASDL